MKKMFSFLALAFTLTAQAQVLPPDQCPVAGVQISRDYVGLASETVGNNFDRMGSSEIPTQSEFAGFLKARIFKVFHERYCVAKVYTYQQQVCADVHPDLALGRGNDTFKALYNLNITLLKRAEIFSQQVKYGIGANQATRITTASEVVKHLTRLAINQGIPKSWEGFVAMMKKIMEEGFLTQAEFDDILVTNAVVNRRNLGFQPLDGVQYNEGKGNGKLARIFDLNITLLHRAALIRKTIDGITEASSQVLAKTFIEFATANGVPQNWTQFVLLMRDSAAKNAISQQELVNITENLESQNRANLGFEIRFFVCKMEVRNHRYNAVEEKRSNEFHQEASKSFRVYVANAPLLAGEKESIEVLFHGLNGLSINPGQHYNAYSVERSAAGEVEIFKLLGARKKVTPPNAIAAQVLHQGSKVNINLQNTAFNPLVGGRVVVEVHFYEKVAILKDKKLGVRTFDLLDGKMTAFTPNVQMIKPKRKVYVQLYMKVVGSPYYNENNSEFKEFKE
jgi:hypothetical protein